MSRTRASSPMAVVSTLILLALASLGHAEDQPRKIESSFSPNGGVSSTIVAALDEAQRELDIAMYSVSTGSRAPIFQALKRATERGVKVSMIFNKARTGARNKQKSLALEGIGVDVRYVTKTMHEKFAIVDRALLLTGSANWSTSADLKHSENMQRIRAPKYVITAFRREFRLLKAKSRDFAPEDFQP